MLRSQVGERMTSTYLSTNARAGRLHDLHAGSPRILPLHDLQSRAKVWRQKPDRLHLHLLRRRLCFCHGHQRIRRSTKTNIRGQQSAEPSKYIPFWAGCRGMYSRTDELL